MAQPEDRLSGEDYAGITTEVKENRNWFMIAGMVLMVLGMAAIAFPFIATLAVELFIGWVLLISGVAGFVHAFRARRWNGFTLTLLGALLAVVLGGLLLFYPLPGIVSITLLLAAFFFVGGLLRIVLAFRLRPLDHWGWHLFSGVLALILAGLILSQMPEAATWVIGLLLGIDLIFTGISLITLAIAARRQA